MQEASRKYSLATLIIMTVVIIIIIVLAFLFYYYATISGSAALDSNPASAQYSSAPHQISQAPVVIPTKVIDFAPPRPLPTAEKPGNCFASSVAAPFREDAFRCMVANAIYDPCFAVNEKGFVYCQVGVDATTGFLMKLTQPLPATSLSPNAQDNWAWYVKLADGTECSPFTGTRPFFANNQVAYYGCKSPDKNTEIVLMGDLTKGAVWTAQEATLTQSGANWTIQSSNQVNIDTVWQ